MKIQSNKSILIGTVLVAIVGAIASFQLGAAPPGDVPKGKAHGHVDTPSHSGRHPVFRLLNPDFSGYGQPFSALGEAKNVIVQIRENGDLTRSYYIRSRYHNNTEQVSVDGVMTVPPLIAHYDFVQVDSDGNVTFISTYIEVPETEDYVNFTAEEAVLDPVSFAKTVTNDTWREDWNCNGGGAISTCSWIGSISGVPSQNNIWSSVFLPLGAGTINGISFKDLRGESNTYTTDVRHRVRARGVGEVLRMDNFRPRMAVYYQANGATGGSLEGTPFAPGAPLEGVLF